MGVLTNPGGTKGVERIRVFCISSCLIAIGGCLLGVYVRLIANREYEIYGAWYTVGYWAIAATILSFVIVCRKADEISIRKDVSLIATIQLASLIIMELVSWTRVPNILVSARLSTAPLVTLLCVAAIGALFLRDYSVYRLVISTMIPVMILGRFSFHFLGGAPEISGVSVFEIRCISELLIPITALILSFSFENPEGDLRRIRMRYENLLCPDNSEHMQERVNIIKRIQVILCTLSLLFSIYSFQIGSYLLLNALFAVPLIVLISDKKANKYLVAVALLTKLIYDLSSESFIKDSECFIFLVVMDILALILALIGYRQACFLINKIQIICLMTVMILYACNSVARDNYVFYRSMALFFSEMFLYESYALFSLWGKWSSCSPLSFYKWLIDPDTDEIDADWLEL